MCETPFTIQNHLAEPWAADHPSIIKSNDQKLSNIVAQLLLKPTTKHTVIVCMKTVPAFQCISLFVQVRNVGEDTQ